MKIYKILFSFCFLCCCLLGSAQVTGQGCLDPIATNYNPEATIEDGSCCYSDHFITVVSSGSGEAYLSNVTTGAAQSYIFPGVATFCIEDGCYSIYFYSYAAPEFMCDISIDGVYAETINGNDITGPSYTFSVGSNLVDGCTDPNSCNYNALATCDDGSCSYECFGCTDPNAPNYSPLATIDNGTCCDASSWYTFNANTTCYANFYSDDPNVGGTIYNSTNGGICLPSDCVVMGVQSLDGITMLTYTLTSPSGDVVASGTIPPGVYQEFGLGLNGTVAGCTDPVACNYNPLATCSSYYDCNYACYGCTNPEAPNYNPTATADDGSCCTDENWVSITASGAGYVHINSYYWDNYYNQYIDVSAGNTSHLCLPDGCYSIDISGSDYLQEISVQINTPDGTLLFDGTTSGAYLVDTFTKNGVAGCNDVNACNYNANATCFDNASCTYGCYGCTNPDAGNYNPDATIDDGSCCLNQYTVQVSGPAVWHAYSSVTYVSSGGSYPDVNSFCVQDGCFVFYVYSTNYEVITYSVLDENGNVVFEGTSDPYGQAFTTFDVNGTPGCTDYSACNYNPAATCPDNSCTYDCYGCTDSNAGNFDPNATIENNTCCYDTWYTIELSEPAYWSVFATYSQYGGGYSATSGGFCMGDQCFALSVYGLVGQPISFTVYNPDGSVFYTGSTGDTGYAYAMFSDNDIYGCMDSNACNYDPTANCSDYFACNYECLGCTNPDAGNYDPEATIDNGTCCLNNWYTIELSGEGYWYVQNYTAGVYGSGNYPLGNGFCSDASCFELSVYSYGLDPVEVHVYNPAGETVFYGLTNVFGSLTGSISSTGEISGCTDPNSCNYNPDATCNDGSCNYYCGGCLDSTALNYNPLAWYDDGNCIYSQEAPMLNMSVETNEADAVYYVRMDMVELGNGAPYLLSSDYSAEMLMIDENGQYYAGPFPCGEDVVMTVQSAQLGMMEYMVSDPLSGSCGIVNAISEKIKPTISIYPNPTTGLLNITGLDGGKLQVDMYDMTGRVVYSSAPNNVGNNFSFDATDLSEGVYQLRIQNNGFSEFQQVVISR